ncbi:MAG: hypothetical protein ABJB76_12100 [Candidatus Nitrosocosmicus sp.]
MSKTNKKNKNNVDKNSLSIEYVDTTRYSTKSQRRDISKNDFICKYCKRRLANSSELNNHMLNKHPQKYQKNK